MSVASFGSLPRIWSDAGLHWALAATWSGWAKAVAMKADTTLRLFLPAWATALRWKWVDTASLPTHGQTAGRGGLDPFMCIADDQLHTAEAAADMRLSFVFKCQCGGLGSSRRSASPAGDRRPWARCRRRRPLSASRLPADAIAQFPHTGLSAPYAKSMFSQYTLCPLSRRLRCVAGPSPATGCRISPEAGDSGKTSHDYDQGA